MAGNDDRSKSRTSCICGNNNPSRFRLLKTPINRELVLIGLCCKKCKTEWLQEDYLPTPRKRNHDSINIAQGNADQTVFKNLPVIPANVQVHSVPVESIRDGLKPGDHIKWERRVGYWHHANIWNVDEASGTIETMEWSSVGCSVGIGLRKYSQPFDQMHRVDYPEEVTGTNSAELILARARSRAGDTGYDLYMDNCESYATYCKTGVEDSFQARWLKWRSVRWFGTLFQKVAVKLIFIFIAAHYLEDIGDYGWIIGQMVGLFILVILEIISFSRYVYRACQSANNEFITIRNLYRSIVLRLNESVMLCIFASGGSIGFEYLFDEILNMCGFGGAVLGGLLGGFVGTVIGHLISFAYGRWYEPNTTSCPCCKGSWDYLDATIQVLALRMLIRIFFVISSESVEEYVVHNVFVNNTMKFQHLELKTEAIGIGVLIGLEIIYLIISIVKNCCCLLKENSAKDICERVLDSVFFCAVATGCAYGFETLFYKMAQCHQCHNYCEIDGSVFGGIIGTIFATVMFRLLWDQLRNRAPFVTSEEETRQPESTADNGVRESHV